MSKILPPFQFKSFSIQHDKCAMKIGVDGVLLAAWVKDNKPTRILDVGTGSGLIAAILRQRFPKTVIDTIEPNKIAFQQSEENFNNLPFSKIINSNRITFQDFNSESEYDIIISNPPFFKENMSSGDENRDEARQSKYLPLQDFFKNAERLISKAGFFAFIYPTSDLKDILNAAQTHHFNLVHKTTILPTPSKPSKRTLFCFSKSIAEPILDELTIEHRRGEYTNKYKELTKDFYLNF